MSMKQRASAALLVITWLMGAALAQHTGQAAVKGGQSGSGRGILLLAHGGKPMWNEEVNKVAAAADKTMPVEVAFGMASKRAIQGAVDRLAGRGVREIVAVPLFVSSHSSVITATEYLLGLRDTAPPELAIYAQMDHGHGGDHAAPAAALDPMTPIKTDIPIRMTSALDRHPLVADILLTRALSISRAPEQEVVVVVAHGPVSEKDNALWLADMQSLVGRIRAAASFKRIEYMTVRDDAPEPVRSQATAELRALVKRAAGEGSRVLIVPLLVSYGGIEEGVRKRLEGLDYTMCKQALLPDERIARWVKLAVEAKKNGE